MAQIELSRGYVALVDECDVEMLAQWSWCAVAPDKKLPSQIYAMTCYDKPNKVKRTVWMHRVIVACPKGMFVDHKNHNPLDNRRENLRICTPAQNSANARWKPGRSGYRGVHVNASGSRFRAAISVAGKMVGLGVFGDPIEAAKAYDAAAAEVYGEFASLNFPAAA